MYVRVSGRDPKTRESLNSERHFRVVPNTVVSKMITDRDFIWAELISNYRYRIELPEELMRRTEETRQKKRPGISA